MRADLVPDDLWERVAPLLPPAPERRRRYPGRLRVPDRAALAGVIYVLRTGVAWRDVPAETVGCSGVTAWCRLRDWTVAGVWLRLHAALLTELRRTDLLDLDDCATDGSTVSMEVYVFADLAPDGRFQRIEETTLVLKGSDADRNLGSAR